MATDTIDTMYFRLRFVCECDIYSVPYSMLRKSGTGPVSRLYESLKISPHRKCELFHEHVHLLNVRLIGSRLFISLSAKFTGTWFIIIHWDVDEHEMLINVMVSLICYLVVDYCLLAKAVLVAFRQRAAAEV